MPCHRRSSNCKLECCVALGSVLHVETVIRFYQWIVSYLIKFKFGGYMIYSLTIVQKQAHCNHNIRNILCNIIRTKKTTAKLPEMVIFSIYTVIRSYSFFRTILQSESQPKVVGMVRSDLTAWLKEVQLEHHNELCQLLEDLGVESLEDFSPVQWFVKNLFKYFKWQAQEVFDYRRPRHQSV